MGEKYYIFEISKHVEAELNTLKSLLNNFEETKNYSKADFIVSYGGDGTLLDCFKKFPYKKIYPIRDYSTCEYHKNRLIDSIYMQSEFDVLTAKDKYGKINALSEIVIRNKDLSKAMRCNLYINDYEYANNIIGDGLIFSTSLGSTGYFKNITNTFFSNGNVGIGFINNAQRMTNFIIPSDSKIKVELVRGECQISYDHSVFDIHEKDSFILTKANFSARLINYKDGFMCPECRKERHSANVNSLYKVL